MFAFGFTVLTLVWWWQGALGTSPLQAYSMTLKEAQGLSLCSYDFLPNVNDDRVPRVVETVVCYTCGKDCNPHGKSSATCMQLTSTVLVTYVSSGLSRNETFPVGCSCVNRRPRKGVFDKGLNGQANLNKDEKLQENQDPHSSERPVQNATEPAATPSKYNLKCSP